MKSLTASLILSAVLYVGFLGMYMPMGTGGDHGPACPFASMHGALCNAPLSHISFWQGLTTAVVLELLLLCFVFALVGTRHTLFERDVGSFSGTSALERVSIRPPLFQELFSAGILNRKEPFSR
jgi:hypothetical protein